MDQMKIRQTAARLIDLRARILDQYPFFGRLLLRLPFGFAECETAYTDMRRIVFDPAFAAELNDGQLSFVILHELMHCVLRHCTRGGGKLPTLYNIACDIVVNSMIMEALETEEIIIADEPLMHLTPDGKEGRLYTAEQVYDMLLEKVDEDFQELYGFSLFDRHDVWESLSSDPIMEDLWGKYVKDAALGAGSGSGIPESVRRVVEVVENKPKISWQQVLHDYIQFDRSDYLFSPPDKRYSDGIILPSFQENVYGSRLDNVWYAVDTSGSINNREIAEAFVEIRGAIEQIENVEGFVSFFDCEITDPLPFDKVEDIDALIPVGGGGTDFGSIFRYMADKLKEKLPRLIIIITDGQATFPPESAALGVPVIWLVTDERREPPFGQVLYIK